jgi:uncharacterized protein DUF3455
MKSNIYTATVRRHSLATRTNLTFSALALALAFASPARAGDNRGPELPLPVCEKIDVPAGNRLSSHVYALGVQIYRWSGTNWAFIAPEATLYSDPCYENEVGIHFAGPTWQANDGSAVKGARLEDCTPYRGAIPWLLLDATPLSSTGVFARVSFIQRVNTIGGTAPAQAGAFVGDEARVPYTTEYYFYRDAKD